MERKIIVDCENDFNDIAILEDDSLVEFYRYKNDLSNMVSNIYIGKVKNVVKGMNAAFIDIGFDKNAYLQVEGNQQVSQGEEVLVQVIKAPYKEKGAVLTQNISIPGKYVVIKPYDKNIYVSSKITDTRERNRLTNIVENEKTGDYGFIIRTDAEGIEESILQEDIKNVENIWNNIIKYYKYKNCYSVVYKETTPLIKIVKDLLTKDVTSFIVNDEEQFNLVREYLEEYYPSFKDILSLYTDEDWHIFNMYKIKSQLDKAMRSKVWLKNGASIVIEPTEALVSIDVNSAKFTGKKVFEQSILKVNKEACNEIAKQIRLRNLSGIIIIDFIDMKSDEHKNTIIETLKESLRKDRIKTVVLGMTQLGLIEMTRKKTSEPLHLQLKN